MGRVTYAVDDGVALVTVDRPHKLNALTLDMYDELGCAFDRARDDEQVGVVVVTGAGDRAFCVGADLHESIPALAEGRFDISHWDGAHQKHSTLYKPVIAAVNGLCLGGGFELMLVDGPAGLQRARRASRSPRPGWASSRREAP